MTQFVDNVDLITTSNVNEYFSEAIQDAISHQNISPKDETIVYIVNLLSHYTLSENIYEKGEEGKSIKPLAFIYKDAMEARSDEERNQCLRKLGDIALFISGFFAGSLNRSLVGVDYFVSMGGNAYSSLADRFHRSYSGKDMSGVFADLSERFLSYVDVLMEVRDSSELKYDSDVLCLYENWLSTGSEYARKRLHENGILTFPAGHKTH